VNQQLKKIPPERQYEVKGNFAQRTGVASFYLAWFVRCNKRYSGWPDPL